MHDQLLYYFEKGFYTLMQDRSGQFCLFTTKDKDGDLRRSGWWNSETEALEQAGKIYGSSKETIEELSKQDNWKVVRVIHPSELMGKGFEVGDKVMFRGEEVEIVGRADEYGEVIIDNGVLKIRGRYVSPSVLTPIYKAEDDEVAKAIKLLKERGKIKDGKILEV